MSRSKEIELAARQMVEALELAHRHESHDSGEVLMVEDALQVLVAVAGLGGALALPADSETCVWTYDDDADKWDAACGPLNSFTFILGDPTHNKMVYCPYCGKRIELAQDGAA